MFMTPFGMPAFTDSSANFSAVNGVTCKYLGIMHETLNRRCSSGTLVTVRYCYSVSHLRGFEDERVPRSEAGGALPRQHHEGIVPRDDDGTHPDTGKRHKSKKTYNRRQQGVRRG